MKINTPPTLSGYKNYLRDFLDTMVGKLHGNSHKQTPDVESIPNIIRLLKGEIQEFEDQMMEDSSHPNALVELCDVANFAFLAFVALRKAGSKDYREQWISENFSCDTKLGRVYCAKNRAGSRYRIGDEIVGWPSIAGYIQIRAQGRNEGPVANTSLPRSHLIWWFANGEWPVGVIDHINRIRTDDRIDNLRDVSYSENSLNTGKPRKYPPFVSVYKPTGREHLVNFGKFVYQRRYKGVTRRYGYYDSPEEASTDGPKKFLADVGDTATLDM